MSDTEKKLAKSLAKALNSIPEAKKEYFLGFAEGVEAHKKKVAKEAENSKPLSDCPDQ